MTSTGFIAQRTLNLAGPDAQPVIVAIGHPAPDGGNYSCAFQIRGLDGETIEACGMGVDGMQALLLTLKIIGATLYTSQDAKAGRLTWLGSTNLGFPVPDSIADLVPADPTAKV
jgi:hypothetical protein